MEEAFWSFIDWAAEWNPTSGMPPAGLKGPITMESLLYIYGLQHAAKLAEYLGRKDEASQFTERAVKVQNAVRTYCINTDGMVQDGPGVEEYSQHCQVFACLTDTIDTDQARVNILRTIEEKDHFAQCTVAMRFYLFRALEKTDLYAYTDQYWEAQCSRTTVQPVWNPKHTQEANVMPGDHLHYTNFRERSSVFVRRHQAMKKSRSVRYQAI